MAKDTDKKTEASLEKILHEYAESFSSKTYSEENDDYDVLMEVFGITPQLKRENRQYWGRELGMCWQFLVQRVFEDYRKADYAPGLRSGDDEMCDLILKKVAIDTKYRVGSGDSGTLKKFKQYGNSLQEKGYEPVLLFLRSDNLDAAMTACRKGGWKILIGDACFEYIKTETKFDLLTYLQGMAKKHVIQRNPSTP